LGEGDYLRDVKKKITAREIKKPNASIARKKKGKRGGREPEVFIEGGSYTIVIALHDCLMRRVFGMHLFLAGEREGGERGEGGDPLTTDYERRKHERCYPRTNAQWGTIVEGTHDVPEERRRVLHSSEKRACRRL